VDVVTALPLLVAVMAGAAAFLLVLSSGRRRNARLEGLAYLERTRPGRVESAVLTAPEALRQEAMSGLPLLNALLRGRDWPRRAARDLERAELRLTVGEYVLMRGMAGAVAALSVALLTGFPLLGLLAGIGASLVPAWHLRRRSRARRAKVEQQLPEMLTLIASALKSGFGLMQALDNVAGQLPPPLSTEVRRLLRDVAVGMSLEEAIGALDERVASKDATIVCSAILVQRTAGGNLAEILETVAHTIRERDRIRGEIRTLTSQQMYTGYLLAGLPVGLAVLLFLMSPEYMGLLISTTLGRVLIAAGICMDVIGFVVIRRILAIAV
jgi:tight adherence protein B